MAVVNGGSSALLWLGVVVLNKKYKVERRVLYEVDEFQKLHEVV